MNGRVDDELRALVKVNLAAKSGGPTTIVEAWIDTAFNGGLVLPQAVVAALGLPASSSTPAILADGRQVELATFTCYLEWFGSEYRTQVVGNDGDCPLWVPRCSTVAIWPSATRPSR